MPTAQSISPTATMMSKSFAVKDTTYKKIRSQFTFLESDYMFGNEHPIWLVEDDVWDKADLVMGNNVLSGIYDKRENGNVR